jgi:hypothetical protein
MTPLRVSSCAAVRARARSEGPRSVTNRRISALRPACPMCAPADGRLAWAGQHGPVRIGGLLSRDRTRCLRRPASRAVEGDLELLDRWHGLRPWWRIRPTASRIWSRHGAFRSWRCPRGSADERAVGPKMAAAQVLDRWWQSVQSEGCFRMRRAARCCIRLPKWSSLLPGSGAAAT